MKRVVFFMLALFIVSISIYGDISKGDWTQDEINYFKTKEYIGNYKFYNYDTKWVPPYIDIGMSENEILGYGSSYADILSKIIITGRILEEDEFRYLSLLKNEIYARNGYIFKDARLKAFFNQMPWYKPISENVQLNGYERTNVRKIKRIENEVRAIVDLKEINPDTFPERYKGRIIINAKWGDRPGEFGYFKHGMGRGPYAFTVDNKSNIYVIDHNNGNIKKYNKYGKFLKEYSDMDYHSAEDIAVDSIGNMYISTCDFHNNKALYHEILKYNQKTGEKEHFWYAGADQKVNILSFHTKVLQNRIIVTKNDKVILDTKEFYKRGERPLLQVNIDRMEVDTGGVVRISNAVDKPREVSIKVPKIFDKKCEPIGIGKGNYAFMITYFGRDKEDNIYVSCEYDIIKGIGETEDKEIEVLYKYNKKGQLIGVIKEPALKEVFAGMSWSRTTRVDRYGNVYFFRPDKNGLKIYKYEMR